MENTEIVDAGVRGLPRPILDGMPAPYSGSDTKHGVPDNKRLVECINKDVCTVCGESFPEDEDRRFTAAHVDKPTILLDFGHLMHERCAKIALAHCPHMREGFSYVFWVGVEEINRATSNRTHTVTHEEILERRMMLSSTSENPNLSDAWRPKNENWDRIEAE